MTEVQQSIAKEAKLSGIGLFLGQPANVTFKPAPDNHGIVFIRTDLGGAVIPAVAGNIIKRARRTALRQGEATIDTCEHCMSALAGLKIDNILIEIDGPELPGLDGSALPYVEALLSCGLAQGSHPRQMLILSEPIVIRQDDAMIAAVPSNNPSMEVTYDLNYPQDPAIGRQLSTFDLGKDDYVRQIAPARTFVSETEAMSLRSRGVGTHLKPTDVLVIGRDGPLGGNKLRFTDEPVKHKILDLIGDLYLLGVPVQARIIAMRSGHVNNHALLRELVKKHRGQSHQQLALHRNLIDIKQLSRILPHRYPMLLVDRVLEIDGERRALGVKNVTINEPFFQGHYPGIPIMPGVLIVESMAQLSGVLLGQRLVNQGKLAILLSLDRVKLRRAVVPGDQLILEAQAARVRSSVAHMRCRAYVGEDLAAEAEIKFMIIDGQQT